MVKYLSTYILITHLVVRRFIYNNIFMAQRSNDLEEKLSYIPKNNEKIWKLKNSKITKFLVKPFFFIVTLVLLYQLDYITANYVEGIVVDYAPNFTKHTPIIIIIVLLLMNYSSSKKNKR